MNKMMRPPPPGSMIRDTIGGIKEETGQDLTIRQVAEGLGVTPKTLSGILNEHEGRYQLRNGYSSFRSIR